MADPAKELGPALTRNGNPPPKDGHLIELFEQLVPSSWPRHNRPGEHLAVAGHPDGDTFTVELFDVDDEDQPVVQRFAVVVEEIELLAEVTA